MTWPEPQTTNLSVPVGLPTAAPAWRGCARAFGSAPVNLDIDVAGTNRARAVTGVLAACVRDADGRVFPEMEIWQWTLNQRLQALLDVRLAAGSSAAPLMRSCEHCGDRLEIELDLTAFVAQPVAPLLEWRTVIPQNGISQNGVSHTAEASVIVFRLPRGRDQQEWIESAPASPAGIAATLIESIDGQPLPSPFRPSSAFLEGAGDALATHDPLTTLTLSAACPECGHTNEIDFDLEAFLLHGFIETQRSLIDDVCRLARAFHWQESEILSMPSWRRARYLEKLDAGGLA